jgi:hypothetical protein
VTKAERLEWLKEWLRMSRERKTESAPNETMKRMLNEFEQDDGSYMQQIESVVERGAAGAGHAISSGGTWKTTLGSVSGADEILKPLAQELVKTTVETEKHASEQSLPVVSDETQRMGLVPLSDNWKAEALTSLKLIDSSANALHSHMTNLLDVRDVRPVIDRTQQAVMCAREISLLIKMKVEMIKAVK